MSGKNKQHQEETHNKVDSAIRDSILPTAASVNEIARQTGEMPSLVLRRFQKMGLKWTGRWVYRHNQEREHE